MLLAIVLTGWEPDSIHIQYERSPQILSVDTNGGWPIQLTALEDPVGFVTWSPETENGSRSAWRGAAA